MSDATNKILRALERLSGDIASLRAETQELRAELRTGLSEVNSRLHVLEVRTSDQHAILVALIPRTIATVPPAA